MNHQEALRSAVARKERHTSLLLGAGLMFAGSAAEPLYRQFAAMRGDARRCAAVPGGTRRCPAMPGDAALRDLA